MQVLFQVLGGDDTVENTVAASFAEVRGRQRGLDLHLYPALLRPVLDVHVLEADGAAVSFFQALDDVAQRRFLDTEQGAGLEDRIEICFAELVTL